MGFSAAGDPVGRGGKQDPVTGMAGLDAQGDRQVGLAGARWAEQDHIIFGGDEAERPEVRDLVAFDGGGVCEVEQLL